MKHFFRLVRFAWPYRARFVASLACALMVAGLWGADIGSVYPLLQILLYDQNGQKWVAQKIETLEADQAILRARRAEVEFVGRTGDAAALVNHFRALTDLHRLRSEEAMKAQRLDALNDSGGRAPLRGRPGAASGTLTLRVAEARIDELKRARALWLEGDRGGLLDRSARLTRDLGDDDRWLARYRWVQPRVIRYFPVDVFNTLLYSWEWPSRGSSCFFRKCLWRISFSSLCSRSGTCFSAAPWRLTSPASQTRARLSSWLDSPTTWIR
jgi:hypothetical protein